jgi:hypothetical protein
MYRIHVHKKQKNKKTKKTNHNFIVCFLFLNSKKRKKLSKTIYIELKYILKNVICHNVLKLIKYEYNKKLYKLLGINCE